MVDDAARLLILGSFPSVQSLAERQYYANPRNAFWPMMAELFGIDTGLAYESRLAALQSHGIALWDVVDKCLRVGSADAKIDRKCLVVNDFGWLFGRYPTISTVCFNGQTAATLFRRLVSIDRALTYHLLPSSSPARAMRPGEKLAAWRLIAQS